MREAQTKITAMDRQALQAAEGSGPASSSSDAGPGKPPTHHSRPVSSGTAAFQHRTRAVSPAGRETRAGGGITSWSLARRV